MSNKSAITKIIKSDWDKIELSDTANTAWRIVFLFILIVLVFALGRMTAF